ncbi:MAG: hypothetical protein [Circular genetic element sp.]|nr:MAG: hypothetical protein [Circular genetic element sp.]
MRVWGFSPGQPRSRESGQLCSVKLWIYPGGVLPWNLTKQCVGVIAKNYMGNPNPRFMAYRKSKGKLARRSKKIEPAVQTLLFTVPVPAGDGADATTTVYCDISQVASLVNRRFYRQGISWPIAGFKFGTQPAIFGAASKGLVTISKLPETWVMSNAWEKGFRTWQKMNDEALEESESIKPRFLDYKIFADAGHHTAGIAANLLPLAFGSGVATAGEWESSKMRIPDTTVLGNTREREIIAVGPNYPGAGASGINAVSLIEGYAASRGLPNVLDPNVPDDAADADGVAPENWIAATFNQGTEQTDEVIADMISENNLAPYPFENDGVNADTMYPNGANQLAGLQIHDFDNITGTTIGGMVRMKGGMFPCGLIRLDLVNQNRVLGQDINFTFSIDLVPGHHRGYLCEPMTEM